MDESMKVEVEQANQNAPGYPLLAQHKGGDIVLFKESGKGTIVKAADISTIGFYYDQFNMSDYSVFNGVVKLSN